MLLTERDKKVIEFISNCPSQSSIIADTFFNSSLICCQRRLKLLAENRLIRRYRDYIGQHFIYYVGKKPYQVDHCLQASMYYSNLLLQGKNVIKFSINKPIGNNLITDAIIGIEEKGNVHVFLLEVEISKNSIKNKIKAYEEFYHSGEVKEVFGCSPKIIFITGKAVRTNNLPVEVIRPFAI